MQVVSGNDPQTSMHRIAGRFSLTLDWIVYLGKIKWYVDSLAAHCSYWVPFSMLWFQTKSYWTGWDLHEQKSCVGCGMERSEFISQGCQDLHSAVLRDGKGITNRCSFASESGSLGSKTRRPPPVARFNPGGCQLLTVNFGLLKSVLTLSIIRTDDHFQFAVAWKSACSLIHCAQKLCSAECPACMAHASMHGHSKKKHPQIRWS